MHIILDIPDETYEMTVSTNAGSRKYTIDDVHYFHELFLRNVPKGDSFDRKYRVFKEKTIPIESLSLSARVLKPLLAANITSVQTLLKYNRTTLLAVKGIGEVSVNEIAAALRDAGYDTHEMLFPGISPDEIEAAKRDPGSVLNLNPPLSDKLYRAGIRTMKELKEMSSDELMRIPGFEYSDFSRIVMAVAEAKKEGTP